MHRASRIALRHICRTAPLLTARSDVHKRNDPEQRPLRIRNPDVLLLLALLARPHRHARTLRTKLLSISTISAQESKLAPQAARKISAREIFTRPPWHFQPTLLLSLGIPYPLS
jgi:hypothetical protein